MKTIFKFIVALAIALLCITNTQIVGYYTRLLTPLVSYLFGLTIKDILEDFDNDI